MEQAQLGTRDVRRIVGGYEILGPLGEGGMATVYLARQTDLDRLVAVKELRALQGSDPSFAKRFLREARMAGSLSHPSIVTVHDYFEAQGVPFIAMEYMERGSLRDYIGQMSLAQVGGVMEALLAGLAHAAQHDIVHRDLKPENLMVSSEGRVKIADFGIAKARSTFQTGGALTADGTALGTPNYMAPEQAMADDVGPWTDLYAVGVIAFEIFTGRPPFADTPQPLVVIMRQVQDPIPLVTDIDPTIDPRIARWIAWLTAKDPAQRPQSAAEAWDAFEEILIAILGPRWQRAARLTPAAAPAAAAAAAAVAAAAAAAVAAPALAGESGTRLLAGTVDPGLEATAAPHANLLGINRTGTTLPASAAQPARKRRAKIALGALALAGVMAALAFAALRPSSSGAPVKAAQPPAAARTSATIPVTASTPAPAARQAPAAPATRAGSMSAQAAAARKLASQYASGAKRIDKLSASGAQANSNLLIAELMRKTASAYTAAAKAADRGDAQGYATAMADAQAAKAEVDQAVASAPGSSSGNSSAAAASPSACAGDSTSDDPSDDSCGGEP